MSVFSVIDTGIQILGFLYVALIVFSGIFDLVSAKVNNRKVRT